MCFSFSKIGHDCGEGALSLFLFEVWMWLLIKSRLHMFKIMPLVLFSLSSFLLPAPAWHAEEEMWDTSHFIKSHVNSEDEGSAEERMQLLSGSELWINVI